MYFFNLIYIHYSVSFQFQLGSLTLPKVSDSVQVIKNMFDLAVNQMTQLKVIVTDV